MNGDTLALVELLLVFGAVMAFGLYQIRSVRKSRRDDRAAKSGSPGQAADRDHSG